MKKNTAIKIATTLSFLIVLNSCASIMDANFKTKEGKESPFKAPSNSYEIPKDPTFRE
jgi:hypothetical protein